MAAAGRARSSVRRYDASQFPGRAAGAASGCVPSSPSSPPAATSSEWSSSRWRRPGASGPARGRHPTAARPGQRISRLRLTGGEVTAKRQERCGVSSPSSAWQMRRDKRGRGRALPGLPRSRGAAGPRRRPGRRSRRRRAAGAADPPDHHQRQVVRGGRHQANLDLHRAVRPDPDRAAARRAVPQRQGLLVRVKRRLRGRRVAADHARRVLRCGGRRRVQLAVRAGVPHACGARPDGSRRPGRDRRADLPRLHRRRTGPSAATCPLRCRAASGCAPARRSPAWRPAARS